MRLTLLQKRIKITSLRRHKERLSSIRIIKGNLAFLFELLPRLLDEGGGSPIPRILGIMPVEIANPVGRVVIAIPSEILLHWSGGCSVGFGGHDGFVAHDAGSGEFFLAEDHVSDGVHGSRACRGWDEGSCK